MMAVSTLKPDLSEALKRAIEESGCTNYAISKMTGVSQSVLNRFVAGDRDITLATAAKIASELGAVLKIRRKN